MKHMREVRVALIAIVALILLYFGFNFLKGINIFDHVNEYNGRYVSANGLVEQAPVYIRGYKVGQVRHIEYDFTRDSAFLVTIAIHDDIRLPQNTRMAIIPDGLLGGTAIELQFDPHAGGSLSSGAYLETTIVPTLVQKLEDQLLAQVSAAVTSADTLICNLNGQLAGNRIKTILAHVDSISTDLTSVSAELKAQLPAIITKVDTTLDGAQVFAQRLKQIEIEQTVARIDSVIDQVHTAMQTINSTDGTIGLLLNDTSVYRSLNATIASADSLLVDLKQNPGRYIHISVFGHKDRKPKKEIKPLDEKTKAVFTNSK